MLAQCPVIGQRSDQAWQDMFDDAANEDWPATEEESTAKGNCDLKKQTLPDEPKHANKDMDAAKKDKAASSGSCRRRASTPGC